MAAILAILSKKVPCRGLKHNLKMQASSINKLLSFPNSAGKQLQRTFSISKTPQHTVSIFSPRSIHEGCVTRLLFYENRRKLSMLCSYQSLTNSKTLTLNPHNVFGITVIRKLRHGRDGGRSSHFVKGKKTVLQYCLALLATMFGVTYMSVPLYRIFCQATGMGGKAVKVDTSKVENMKPNLSRPITVKFNADTSAALEWKFRPLQHKVKITPGETALAFYTATNPTSVPIIGISTYNILPFEAGKYFNKIQCFCFEEQRLNPKEQVDMPVFFYIDPEFAEDPSLLTTTEVTLSYTFFQSKDQDYMPLPGFMQPEFQEKEEEKRQQLAQKQYPYTEGGLVYMSAGVTKELVVEGSGDVVQPGSDVTVACTGMLLDKNRVFWSTKKEGEKPFTFKVGSGQVIPGWDEGCLTMKKGERARFTLAPHKAYGEKGFPAWNIAPNTSLVFDIELLNIR